MSRTVSERLSDVLNAIEKIEIADSQLAKASSQGNQALLETAFDAILFNLFVIGEAVKALPNEVTLAEPEIIHNSVQRDLLPLKATVSRMTENQSQES